MFQETTRLTAAGMRTEFCKVLEYLPNENRFLVRAGVGWGPGGVVATIEADIQSPAGFALRTGQPVISNRLEDEHRFHTPELLTQHGIHRDEGKGLPANFDPRAAAGLGMRIVQSFCAQLGAQLAVQRLDPGTEFVVAVPIEHSQ
jgi:hypothetical protein